jgi:F0F1-type ATP synthase epsilon subunit
MFIVTCVVVAIAVFGMIGILMSKMPLMFKVSSSVQLLVSGGIAVVGAMFLYIMCDRALLGKKKEGFTAAAAKKHY